MLHIPVPTDLSNPMSPEYPTLEKDHPIHCSPGILLAHPEATVEAILLPRMFFSALCTPKPDLSLKAILKAPLESSADSSSHLRPY